MYISICKFMDNDGDDNDAWQRIRKSGDAMLSSTLEFEELAEVIM